MGKRMTAKKKKNQNRAITAGELTRAQRRVDKELGEIKTSATQNGTLMSQCLIYLAILHTHPSWSWKAILNIQKEADAIADRIADPDTEYGFTEVYAELAEHGINVQF